ncbi:MAG: LD-carboxypeptidase [Candidatus Diapherotrites archaeon]
MKLIKPVALRSGDSVRIITPSDSAVAFGSASQQRAEKVLKSMGLRVSFSKNFGKSDGHTGGTIEERLNDFMEAFEDDEVQCVMPLYGGFNANQLLPFINFKTIRTHDKTFIGFSDISCLNLAILAKAGVVNFSGPCFSTFSQPELPEFTLRHFRAVVFDGACDAFDSSERFAEDAWWKSDSQTREWKTNPSVQTLRKGKASGVLVGGNLSTTAMLCGTPFLPKISNPLVFLEEDHEGRPVIFDRQFHQLLQAGFFKNAQGLLLGRTETAAGFSLQDSLARIVLPATQKAGIPVLSEMDFGHTDPLLTIPLGIRAELDATSKKVRLLESAVLP